MGIDYNLQLARLFEKAEKIFFRNVTIALTKLGEECVVRIRNRSQEVSWYDHTGNLRSSIGYAVYDEGLEVMKSSFEVVLGGQEGSMTGDRELRSLAGKYGDVLALVVIAGMSYADKVEAIESKDVLASTKVWAESIVQERIKRAVDAAVNEINNL